MPLAMRLVKDQELETLDSVLTTAYLLGDKTVLESPDFWLIWGRVADHIKQPLRSSLCYSMALILNRQDEPNAATSIVRSPVP